MDNYRVNMGDGVFITVQLDPEDAQRYGKRATKIVAAKAPAKAPEDIVPDPVDPPTDDAKK